MNKQVLWAVGAAALFMACSATARAEDQQDLRQTDFYISFFAGRAFPNTTDIRTDNPAAQDFTAKDAKLSSSLSLGGKIGVWIKRLRPTTGVDIGLEWDVTNFSPDQVASRYPGSGSSGGLPVTSVITPQMDMNSNVVTLNVLIRKPIAVTQELPNGRWFPYIGIGGGWQSTTYASGGIKTDPAFKAMAGAQLFVTKHIGLFGEYKFTYSEQNLGFTSPTTGAIFHQNYVFSVNHLVGGVALHF